MPPSYNSSTTRRVADKSPSTMTTSSSSRIPAPFSPAPSSVQPLLSRLDPSQVYLVHIDRHPVAHKQTIFLIPVLLNSLIALLLAWRIWSALPVYLAIIQGITLETRWTGGTKATGTQWQAQVWLLLRRTAMFACDFFLLRFIGPWPLTFFFEQPANPVLHRWGLGFRPEEVVVRVSRNWNAADLLGGAKRGQESPFWTTRVLPAVEKGFVRQKTGYLMQGKDWDLDFALMLDAHTLLARQELRWRDVENVLFVHKEGEGWLAWQWESQADVIEERRRKVVLFKERLTKIGKESLFWTWMEIIESERDRDGGFTPEGQRRVRERVSKAFEKEGVDFEDLEKQVGGLEQLDARESPELGK